MWDSGCSYTLLTADAGRMWDGARDKMVRFTGFVGVGEQRVGKGGRGGPLYALLKRVDGRWRVECFGETNVADGAKDNLMGGRGAQRHGLGGTLRPNGGAELQSICSRPIVRGMRYELSSDRCVRQARTTRLTSSCPRRSELLI